MNCPICGEFMDETIDDGGVDYADEFAVIHRCEACGYREVRGWGYTGDDDDEYPVIAPALAGSEALAKDTTFAEPPANMLVWGEVIDERDALKAENARLRAALEMLVSEADKVADSIEVSSSYDVRVLKETCFNAAQILAANAAPPDDEPPADTAAADIPF